MKSVLLVVLCSFFFATSASAVELRAEKDTYGRKEPVTVIFSGIPTKSGMMIDVAPASYSRMRQYGAQNTDGQASGKLTFKGFNPGKYEVRLFAGRRRITATAKFTVVKTTSPAPTKEVEVKPKPTRRPSGRPMRVSKPSGKKPLPSSGNPTMKVTKELFLDNEDVIVEFAGCPTGEKVVIDIASPGFSKMRHSSPKGTGGQAEGQLNYGHKRPGKYEARLYVKGGRRFVLAQKFKVEKAPEKPKPEGPKDTGTAAEKELLKKIFEKTEYCKKITKPHPWFHHNYFQNMLCARDYHEYFVKLNFVANQRTINTLMPKFPVFGKKYQAQYAVQQFGEFKKNLIGVVKDFVLEDLKRAVKFGYEVKKTNNAGAIDRWEIIALICKEILAVVPDLDAIKEVKESAEKPMLEALESVYASDFHRSHVNKIAFSTEPITVGKESASAIKKSFKADETIYGMAYFRGVLSEIASHCGVMVVTLKNGAEKLAEYRMPIHSSPYLSLEISPNVSTAKAEGADKIVAALAALDPGVHELTIEIGERSAGLYKRYFAEDIKFDLSSGKETLAAKVGPLKQSISDNRAKLATLPEDFTDPGAPFSDPALSQENLNKLLNSKTQDLAEIIKIVPCGTSTTNWYIKKNALGVPLHRTTIKNIMMLYKKKDGTYHYVTNITIRSKYAGGGTWGQIYICDANRPIRISPEKIKGIK